MKNNFLFLLTVLFFTSINFAQNIEDEFTENYLKDRSGLDFKIGIYNNSSVSQVSAGPGSFTSSAALGFIGSVDYHYWFKDYLSFRIGASALVTEANSTFEGTEASSETVTVIPVLAGVNFYPLQLSNQSKVLPYLSLSAGPYIGVYSRNVAGVLTMESETAVETAFGGSAGAGLDFLIGSIFKIGVAASYNFITDFNKPIGGKTNYSGPQYSFKFGFLF